MRLLREGRGVARCSRMAGVALWVCLAACVSSHQLIGTAREPIPADRVQLYTEVPLRPYERIAVVSASSKRSWSFTLEGISDEAGPTIGADVGTGYEGPRGTIDVGVGASTLMLKRYGRGIAIYVPER